MGGLDIISGRVSSSRRAWVSAAHRRTSSWTKTPLLDYRDATTANFVINLYNSSIMKEKRDAFISLLKQVEIDIFKLSFSQT